MPMDAFGAGLRGERTLRRAIMSSVSNWPVPATYSGMGDHRVAYDAQALEHRGRSTSSSDASRANESAALRRLVA